MTKYRRHVFTKAHLDSLRSILAAVCRDFDAELVEFDGEHVDLLVHYPPKVTLSKLVNSLKGVSSRMLPSNTLIWYRATGKELWSPNYFAASCGGAPLIIKQYIENQRTPD